MPKMNKAKAMLGNASHTARERQREKERERLSKM